MHASDTPFDSMKILKGSPDESRTLFVIPEYVCNSKKRKRNSYLEKQIRGAKDKKAQIPCRASVHPCIQWVTGHRPATGAALTGCGRTQREAAGAVTAGVVVTHPAKIQVIGMGKGKMHKDIALTPHRVLTDIPVLPFTLLSPPFLLCTPHSSITDTHSLLSLHSPGIGTHTHSGDLHLAVLLPLLQSLCIRDWVYVCMCKEGRERVGWWVDEWVDMAEGGRRRRRRSRRRRGEGWGKVQSRWAASSAKTPLTCPPQAVDTELLYNLKSFTKQKRGGSCEIIKHCAFNWMSPVPRYLHTSYTLFMRGGEGDWIEERKREEALQLHKGGRQRRQRANRAAVLMRIWDERENKIMRVIE